MTVEIMVKGKRVKQEITDAQILEYMRGCEEWELIVKTVAYEQYCKANPGVLTSPGDVFA